MPPAAARLARCLRLTLICSPGRSRLRRRAPAARATASSTCEPGQGTAFSAGCGRLGCRRHSGGARSQGAVWAPDPLLDRASELVYELMHASRVYGVHRLVRRDVQDAVRTAGMGGEQ